MFDGSDILFLILLFHVQSVQCSVLVQALPLAVSCHFPHVAVAQCEWNDNGGSIVLVARMTSTGWYY
jgi:hypothetical protein